MLCMRCCRNDEGSRQHNLGPCALRCGERNSTCVSGCACQGGGRTRLATSRVGTSFCLPQSRCPLIPSRDFFSICGVFVASLVVVKIEPLLVLAVYAEQTDGSTVLPSKMLRPGTGAEEDTGALCHCWPHALGLEA